MNYYIWYIGKRRPLVVKYWRLFFVEKTHKYVDNNNICAI
nr:MAG TPA: hypothetical protein [Bacteriophage sp.]